VGTGNVIVDAGPAIARRRERSADAITTDLRIELEGVKRQLETKTKAGKRQMEILQSKLRSQASEIDRLEAENSELRSEQ
jgi:hypothetical protein